MKKSKVKHLLFRAVNDNGDVDTLAYLQVPASVLDTLKKYRRSYDRLRKTNADLRAMEYAWQRVTVLVDDIREDDEEVYNDLQDAISDEGYVVLESEPNVVGDQPGTMVRLSVEDHGFSWSFNDDAGNRYYTQNIGLEELQ